MNAKAASSRPWGQVLLLVAACAGAPLGAAPLSAGDAGRAATMGIPAPPKAYFQSLLQATETTAPRAPHPLLTGESAEPRPSGHDVFLAYLAQSASSATGVATLHDFLVIEEGALAAPDSSSTPAPRPRQAVLDSLLADLTLALSTLEDAGAPQTFLASRQTDPSAFLTVALQSRPQTELY